MFLRLLSRLEAVFFMKNNTNLLLCCRCRFTQTPTTFAPLLRVSKEKGTREDDVRQQGVYRVGYHAKNRDFGAVLPNEMRMKLEYMIHPLSSACVNSYCILTKVRKDRA